MSAGIEISAFHSDRNRTTISGNQVLCGSPDGIFGISSSIAYFGLSAFVIVVALHDTGVESTPGYYTRDIAGGRFPVGT